MSKAMKLWPTPRATEWKANGYQQKGKYKWPTLTGAVRGISFPTPTANRWDGLQSHGTNVVSGQLNPTWVEWLQGFPLGWTEVE